MIRHAVAIPATSVKMRYVPAFFTGLQKYGISPQMKAGTKKFKGQFWI